MRQLFITFFACLNLITYSQDLVFKGKVLDNNKEPLLGVNVFLNSKRSYGTITDFDGYFHLLIEPENKNDTIIFSAIGYDYFYYPLSKHNFGELINIKLFETSYHLDQITISAKSISEEFSVVQAKKLDIYLNASSAADPLKMITELPSSTNTDETANPKLRGSAFNRSLVYMNGAPVNSPVRNSQLNGIGFFSLFNTAIIKNQNVYASNPPLIYGNSSAGIVEIETDDNQEYSYTQLSISLANVGFLTTQKKGDKNFLQIYGNYQFSPAFKHINHNSDVERFGSKDLGINMFFKTEKKITINFFNYLIDESSSAKMQMFNFNSNSEASRIRNFNILNLKFNKGKNFFSGNFSSDFSKSGFDFGKIKTSLFEKQFFYSLNYKYIPSAKWTWQTGFSQQYKKYQFTDSIPVFYFALQNDAPVYFSDTSLTNNIRDIYSYCRWNPAKKITIGVGIRTNSLFSKQNYYSYQLNLRWDFFPKHKIMAAVGQYNSYNLPEYLIKNNNLLKSRQLHLEYAYQRNFGILQMAAYFKEETGDLAGDRSIWGLELYYDIEFADYFKFSLSNTFLKSELDTNQYVYSDDYNLAGFVKSTVSYSNIKIFSASFSFIYHPGKYFTPVSYGLFNDFARTYQPVYEQDINSDQFKNYYSVNITLSRIFPLRKSYILVFASCYNVLNTKNQKERFYNTNYTHYDHSYYQLRSFYFGLMLNLSHARN